MALAAVFMPALGIYKHTAILLLSIILCAIVCVCVCASLVLTVIYFDSCKRGSDETTPWVCCWKKKGAST